jgi:hypothetical protein
LDVVCVTGRDINELRLGRGEVAWRVPVKAFQEEKLRPKVASKMTVATLLAGFSFAALLQLMTEKQLPTIRGMLLEPSLITGLAAALLWLAAISLTGALGFFIATVYAYDRLSMPEGFWAAGSSGKRDSLPAFVREDRKQHGPIYAHMIHIWSYVFTPGVILAGIGLLLIAIDAGSIELGVLCAVALGAISFYYRRIRPQLGVD